MFGEISDDCDFLQRRKSPQEVLNVLVQNSPGVWAGLMGDHDGRESGAAYQLLNPGAIELFEVLVDVLEIDNAVELKDSGTLHEAKYFLVILVDLSTCKNNLSAAGVKAPMGERVV